MFKLLQLRIEYIYESTYGVLKRNSNACFRPIELRIEHTYVINQSRVCSNDKTLLYISINTYFSIYRLKNLDCSDTTKVAGTINIDFGHILLLRKVNSNFLLVV